MDAKKYNIACFHSVEELLASEKQFDIYIIDIVNDATNEPDGLHAGIKMKKRYPKSKIIFLCEDDSYLDAAYAAKVSCYLQKPIYAEKLYNCFDQIIENLKPKRALIPTSGLNDEVIIVEEIAYVDIEGRNLCFHFKDGSKVTSVAIRAAFKKEVARFINLNDLFFATTTLLVNIDYIKTISKNKIVFRNGQELYTTEKAIKLIKEEILFNK